MNFAIIGGDERMVRLSRLLGADGHAVRTFALEKALPCTASAEEVYESADCIVLPLPCTRGGMLNAPLSEQSHSVESVLSHAASGTIVCAGQASNIVPLCRRLGLSPTDYFQREELVVKNALLTAEGTLSLLLQDSRSLAGCTVLLCGFGRISRLLAPRLLASGAKVSVAARSQSDLAWAECMNCRSLDLKKRPALSGFDYAVNTIPAPIFGEDALKDLAPAKLIELASPPYGFDAEAAARLGLTLTVASGLPGKTAPASAAAAIRDTIYHILEEST